MGVNTDGILFWGITWDDNTPPWSAEEKNEEEELNVWVRLDAWEKQGVETIAYCSDAHPMYGLAIKETVHTAWRGEVIEPDLNRLAYPEEEWYERLEKFCLDWGIPCPDRGKMGPKLVSWWG